MPTVPVTFFNLPYSGSVTQGGITYPYPASSDYMVQWSYDTADGTHHTGHSDINSYPFTIEPDGYSNLADRAAASITNFTHFDAVVEYPEEWLNASITMWVNVTHPDSSPWGQSWSAIVRPPLMGAPSWRLLDLPYPHSSIDPENRWYRYDEDFPQGVPLADDPMTFTYSTHDPFFLVEQVPFIFNTSQYELEISYDLVIDYGDGTTETKTNTVTIPGALQSFRGAPGDGYYHPLPAYAVLRLYAAGDTGWVNTDTGIINQVLCSTGNFTHTYATSGHESTKWMISDSRGQNTTWYSALNIKPVPVASGSITENIASLLAENSFDIDGSIVSYHWYFPDTMAVEVTTEPEIEHTYLEEYLEAHEGDTDPDGSGPYVISLLYVTDDDGRVSDPIDIRLPYELDGNTISAIGDSDGVGYVAVKQGSDIQTKQYSDGYASEVLRATLPNHDNPTLYQLPNSSRFFLSARDRATDSYTLYYSDDNCNNFQVVT